MGHMRRLGHEFLSTGGNSEKLPPRERRRGIDQNLGFLLTLLVIIYYIFGSWDSQCNALSQRHLSFSLVFFTTSGCILNIYIYINQTTIFLHLSSLRHSRRDVWEYATYKGIRKGIVVETFLPSTSDIPYSLLMWATLPRNHHILFLSLQEATKSQNEMISRTN
jgi:hypothetical protein